MPVRTSNKVGGRLSLFVVLLASVTLPVVGWLALSLSIHAGRWAVALLVPPTIALRGYRSKSLDPFGAYSALAVGFTLAISHSSFTAALLTFFFSSSKLTKFRQNKKRQLEADFKEGERAAVVFS